MARSPFSWPSSSTSSPPPSSSSPFTPSSSPCYPFSLSSFLSTPPPPSNNYSPSFSPFSPPPLAPSPPPPTRPPYPPPPPPFHVTLITEKAKMGSRLNQALCRLCVDNFHDTSSRTNSRVVQDFVHCASEASGFPRSWRNEGCF